MTQQPESFDSIEAAIAELDEAARAGVFAQTPIDVDAAVGGEAVASPGIVRLLRKSRVWVPLAAAAVLAIVVTGAMFSYQIKDAHEQARLAGRLKSEDMTQLAAAVPVSLEGLRGREGLTNCLNGPGSSVPGDCRSHDLDADGDVDLADIQAYQLAFATP